MSERLIGRAEELIDMIGKTLGHYHIGEQLGRGGMGEVYVADDLNLNRKVALKFLPEAFSSDPERMARFEREAKLLASLNHPNIAGIYGLEQADGNRFLVLEYVEGETLQARLSKGALPLEDALLLCRQIAEGLEAAHEKGVIHRDLKPANVMITAEEKVKILDFGLAKAFSDETQSIDSSQSPTLTEAMTRPGVILGTAAYMSPEQAKGKSVDKRADIWAFGCILYECLTGKRAFRGETVTETLAAVIKETPDWEALPTATLPNIRFALRRCLEKEISRRFQNAADVRILVEEPPEAEATATPRRSSWFPWALAAALFAALSWLALLHFSGKKPAAMEKTMSEYTPPASQATLGSFSLSPDGRYLAFAGVGSDGKTCLYLRDLRSLDTRPLPGTESSVLPPFFWDPDSRFIAFDAGGKLKKADITGGQPTTICEVPGIVCGGSWNRDDQILFGNLLGSIMLVSAGGGTPASPATRIDFERESGHLYPAFLPDGKHFLYFSSTGATTNENQGIYIGSLTSSPDEQNPRQLMKAEHGFAYISPQDPNPGFMLFVRGQTLMAQVFDDKRLELVGDPERLTEQLGYFSLFYPFFSASANGVLAYRSSSTGQLSRAAWFDRQGNLLGTTEERASFYGFALAPDGTRAAVGAVGMVDSTQTTPDIWVLDFFKNIKTGLTRLTYGQGLNATPKFSNDLSRVFYASNHESGVYQLYQKLSSGGEEELLYKSGTYKFPTSCSRDGRFLLFNEWDQTTFHGNVSVLSMGDERKSRLLIHSPEFNEIDGRFSPDGKWIAYMSNETGRNEIWVRPFTRDSAGEPSAEGGKWPIGAGTGPRWGREGRELYYRAPDGNVMVVEVIPAATFRKGEPQILFKAPLDLSEQSLLYSFPSWDVTADGNRFFMPTPADISPTPFIIVHNWNASFKK